MLSDSDIQKMADIIAERFRPEKIILFGSRARGEATPESDVDMLVIAETGVPRYKRAIPIYRLLGDFRTGIDILVYTPEEIKEWSSVPEALVTRAHREGEILYERSA